MFSLLDKSGRDRGSITLWFLLASVAMIIVLGLAVDLGGQVYTQQRARGVAAQAARTAGQQIGAPQAIRGTAVEASPARAAQAARNYLRASGMAGSVDVNGTTVVVHTSDIYKTKFLSIIGLNTLPATGKAEVRIVRVLNGAER